MKYTETAGEVSATYEGTPEEIIYLMEKRNALERLKSEAEREALVESLVRGMANVR
jgi:hypothetical protein